MKRTVRSPDFMEQLKSIRHGQTCCGKNFQHASSANSWSLLFRLNIVMYTKTAKAFCMQSLRLLTSGSLRATKQSRYADSMRLAATSLSKMQNPHQSVT